MDILQTVQNFVGPDNAFFKGGLMIGLFGMVGSYLRNIPGKILEYVREKLIYSIKIDSLETSIYDAFVEVLTDPGVKVSHRTFKLTFKDETVRQQSNADFFVCRFRGFRYHVRYEETKVGGSDSFSPIMHSYTISSYFRSREAMACLLKEIQHRITGLDEHSLQLYYATNYGHFEDKIIKKRTLDTLYYEESLIADLVSDLKSFEEEKGWYEKLNIPYKRSYMLYGPPGTGKTSLIKGIATHFNKPIYIIGEGATSGDALGRALGNIPAGSVVVMEDFDRVIQAKGSLISLNTLLNQLDGLETREGMVLFITANQREVFDAALERPGRIDRKFLIGYLKRPAAEKMFMAFYGPDHLASFSKVFIEDLYTPAQLQVFFSKYKAQPEVAVARFPQMLQEIGEPVVHKLEEIVS